MKQIGWGISIGLTIALIIAFLSGCATPSGSIEKTPTGVIMKANRPSVIKYTDKDITVEFNSKGQSLINVPLDLDIE